MPLAVRVALLETDADQAERDTEKLRRLLWRLAYALIVAGFGLVGALGELWLSR